MTYNQDINKFYACKEIIRKSKLSQKEYRKSAHKSFLKENRKWFWFFDIAVALMIIFNYGALFTTNFLLMANTEIKLYESNPVQTFMNNYEVHKKAQSQFIGFYFQMIIWGIIIFSYLFFRTHIFEYTDFYYMSFFIVFYLFTMSYDFINDFGLFIGKIFFGV